jgi:hypothetical protein
LTRLLRIIAGYRQLIKTKAHYNAIISRSCLHQFRECCRSVRSARIVGPFCHYSGVEVLKGKLTVSRRCRCYNDQEGFIPRYLMDPKKLFADERHGAFCVFCGAPPQTREHVASKVLLDDPLPPDLPLVYSCHACNNGFSRDEEYVACLIDCVVSGSTDPAKVQRTKVRASLQHSSALATRIEASRRQNGTGLIWVPDQERVRNVIVKLARGHAARQYSEPRLNEPDQVMVAPLVTLSPDDRIAFETVPDSQGWPEIGSRAFMNLVVASSEVHDVDSGWTILQTGRYRYVVSEPGRVIVRIVLSEYLSCEVSW